MTPLEASTTCLFNAEYGLQDRSARRITGTQASADSVVVSGVQKKFGTYSLDAYNNTGGLRFDRGAPFSPSTWMTMECWAYFRSHRADNNVRVLSSANGSTPQFSLKNDSAGRPVLEFYDGNNNANAIGQISALPLNQWVHLAATCDGNFCRRLYVDGVLIAAAIGVTNSAIGTAASNTFVLGGLGTSLAISPDAYIDDARFVYGYPVFENEVAAQSAAWPDSVGAGDASFASVSLLLHGEGSNGGTTITDSSGNALTATQNGSSGNVTTSTAAARFGSASLRFGGTQSISYGTSSLFELASRDFTVECQFNADTTTSSSYPVIWQIGTGTGNRVVLYFTPSDLTVRLDVYSSSTYQGGIAFPGLAPGNWQRTVLVKQGSIYTLWLDGRPVGSFRTTASPTGNLNLCLGWQHYGGNSGDFFKGYIEEFRITAGVARQTLNFTPAATALPEVARPSEVSGIGAFGAYQAPLFSAAAGKSTPAVRLVRAESSGRGTIGLGVDPGEVLEQGTPNTPLRRRVWLMRDRDGVIVREAWSDAATGRYSFTEIDETLRYSVIAFDYMHNYRAVIADNLTPEVI